MTFTPTGGDADRADQRIPADPAAPHPLADRIRGAFESSSAADRVDRAWVLPADDGLDLLAY
ncbi:hypothetical protein AB0H71_06085 [Nocardia sp. NPDC050697]|uniref:hypothetical protein n=1 Tax=Nocardia sp. NPDC050697 TaxID=3155158 RepID=UPI0033E99B0D